MRKKEFKIRTLNRIKIDITLHSSTLEPTATVTKWICEETSAELQPDQIGTFLPYGGKNCSFQKKKWMLLRPAYTLYPNEEWINGSSSVVDSMVRRLVARNKIAIVRIIPRKNALLKFAALLPKWNNEQKEKVIGFTMIFLPFAEDIKDPSSLPQTNEGE